jgi:uncharacterized protein
VGDIARRLAELGGERLAANLEVVVGHWGEVVMFYLDRVDNLAIAAGLARPISEYFRTNVLVTPRGIFSQRYLRWALEVVGVDRILFSTDYPYRFVPHSGARCFLEEADLTEKTNMRRQGLDTL